MPLYTILLAMGNPTVHFFSLDVEGAEFPVLKTIPWDKVLFLKQGVNDSMGQGVPIYNMRDVQVNFYVKLLTRLTSGY